LKKKVQPFIIDQVLKDNEKKVFSWSIYTLRRETSGNEANLKVAV
jgi:hypothetical protein